MCRLELVRAIFIWLLCASPSVTAQCLEDVEGAAEGTNAYRARHFLGVG